MAEAINPELKVELIDDAIGRAVGGTADAGRAQGIAPDNVVGGGDN